MGSRNPESRPALQVGRSIFRADDKERQVGTVVKIVTAFAALGAAAGLAGCEDNQEVIPLSPTGIEQTQTPESSSAPFSPGIDPLADCPSGTVIIAQEQTTGEIPRTNAFNVEFDGDSVPSKLEELMNKYNDKEPGSVCFWSRHLANEEDKNHLLIFKNIVDLVNAEPFLMELVEDGTLLSAGREGTTLEDLPEFFPAPVSNE